MKSLCNKAIQLAKELDCFPPELFLNPYSFLEKQLQDIQAYPLDDGLDMLSNLSKYLNRRSKNSLINTLYRLCCTNLSVKAFLAI